MRNEVTESDQIRELKLRLQQSAAEIERLKLAVLSAEESAQELHMDLVQCKAGAIDSLKQDDNLLAGLKAMSEALHIADVFSAMLDTLSRILNFEDAFVLLQQPENQHLHVAASSNPLYAGTKWVPDTMFYRVVAGQITAVFDTSLIPEWQSQSAKVLAGAVSALHIPVNSEHLRGILVCVHARKGYFTKKHIMLAERFTPFASQALQNAWMFTAVKSERDSAKKRVKERTREIERLARFPEENPNPVVRVSSQGEIRYLNGAARALLSNAGARVPVSIPSSWERAIEEVNRTNQDYVSDCAINDRVFRCTFAQVLEFDYINVYAHDITERIDAERQLQLQAVALESAANSIAIVDRSGLIRWVNSAMSELTGFEKSELVGSSFKKLSSGRQDKSFYAQMWDQILTGQIWEGELVNRRKDGTLYTEEMTIAPVRDKSGEISNFIAVKQDITERKLAQDKLHEAIELAEEAVRAKSAFLASMSHEIRTPLNAIIGLTGLLLDTEMDEQQRKFITTVRHSGRTLLSIINNILDFSRFDSGQFELEMAPFDLKLLVSQTCDLLRNEAAMRGIELTYHIARNVPQLLEGDETRIRQVLLNLVSNGLKFTHEGSVSVHVTAKTVTDQQVELYFEVVDSGIGIPDDRLSRLFQPFSQADASTTRKYGGTGLGLAISKQLVELMGGEIAVRSEPHVGSCFSFTLNVKRSVAMGTAQLRQLAELDFDSHGSRSMRVLVAEDDAVNQMVITHMLKQIGYECDVTGNGLEALQALRRQPYDVILMDAQMPEMDGVQATGVIRKEWSSQDQPYVIAVTANALRGDRERMIAAGMDDYVSKPVSMEELLSALSRAASVIQRNHRGHPGTTTQDTEAAEESAVSKRPDDMASPVDVDLFMERLGENQHALLAQLLALFLEEAREVLPLLRKAFDDGDRQAQWQWAHKLRGSSSGSAATRFALLCEELLSASVGHRTRSDMMNIIKLLDQEFLDITRWAEQNSLWKGDGN